MSGDIEFKMIELPVTMIKQDPALPETQHNDEGTHVRVVGCAEHRQCIVEHFHGSLVLHERGKRDGHLIFLNLDQIFRKAFVSILKANDGELSLRDALDNGMDRLITYDDTVETLEEYNARFDKHSTKF